METRELILILKNLRLATRAHSNWTLPMRLAAEACADAAIAQWEAKQEPRTHTPSHGVQEAEKGAA